MQYDIAVIGNDEAAFDMLRLATGANRRAVAVLPEIRHSDWIVTQALRRLAVSLLVDRTEGRKKLFRSIAAPRLLRSLVSAAICDEVGEHITRLTASGVTILTGEAHFTGPTSVSVRRAGEISHDEIHARHIVIATGVLRTAIHQRLSHAAFQCPDKLFRSRRLPRQLHVIGGGDFGTGLATLLSLFGVQTGLITREDGSAVVSELATAAGVITGHRPGDVGLPDFSVPFPRLASDIVDCRRSVGFTRHLNLAAVGVDADENGQLWCAGNFETWCSGIYGIGDVVGFSPATTLEATDQAERVMNHIIHGNSKAVAGLKSHAAASA